EAAGVQLEADVTHGVGQVGADDTALYPAGPDGARQVEGLTSAVVDGPQEYQGHGLSFPLQQEVESRRPQRRLAPNGLHFEERGVGGGGAAGRRRAAGCATGERNGPTERRALR